MYIESGNKHKNIRHADDMIMESANLGADMVLLPEAMNLGWTHPSAKVDADAIPDGATCKMLIQAAKNNNVFICSGLVEQADTKVFNSAVIISPDGEIILHHRKINELGIGLDYYDQGDKLNVCHTELGNLGLMICADAFADGRVLSRSLCYMGADVILSPSCWAVPKNHDNKKDPAGKIWYNHYHSVAKKFKVCIAGVSNVGTVKAGPWKDYQCIGNSLVIDSNGGILAEGPYGVNAETILMVEINPVDRPARGCSWIDFWGNDA